MVEDRVTDGTRIAQLLASELSGRGTEGLGVVSVVDAEPDAEPTEEGTVAYRVAVREEPVAVVVMYPEEADLDVRLANEPTSERSDGQPPLDPVAVRDRAREAGLAVREAGPVVRIDSGAAVKRAVDAIRAGRSRPRS